MRLIQNRKSLTVLNGRRREEEPRKKKMRADWRLHSHIVIKRELTFAETEKVVATKRGSDSLTLKVTVRH